MVLIQHCGAAKASGSTALRTRGLTPKPFTLHLKVALYQNESESNNFSAMVFCVRWADSVNVSVVSAVELLRRMQFLMDALPLWSNWHVTGAPWRHPTEFESHALSLGGSALFICSHRAVTLRRCALVMRRWLRLELSILKCTSPRHGTHGGQETRWQTRTRSYQCGRLPPNPW